MCIWLVVCLCSCCRLIIFGHLKWHPAKHQFTWIRNQINQISVCVCVCVWVCVNVCVYCIPCCLWWRCCCLICRTVRTFIAQTSNLSNISFFSSTSCVLCCMCFLLLLSQIFIDHWHVYHISIEHIINTIYSNSCVFVELLFYSFVIIGLLVFFSFHFIWFSFVRCL